jgi:hypothetical protein
MPENARLNGCLDEINLDFVEREATPRLLMKLSIQLHLAGFSLSNTISILEIFGVERVDQPFITGSDTRNMETGMLSNVFSEIQISEPDASRTVLATPKQKPPSSGSDRSASH